MGDSPQLVEDTIDRAKARVTDTQTVNGRKVLVVQGHPDPRLLCSKFTFDNDALIEVELEYADSAWDTSKIQSIFDQTRRNLDRKYGTSRNIRARDFESRRSHADTRRLPMDTVLHLAASGSLYRRARRGHLPHAQLPLPRFLSHATP